jgi:Fe-S-cluster-containing dehydrogenase component/DMSO reductase anchor subunit
VASPAPGRRPAFVFAPDRCTGCEACRIACGIENAGGRDKGWRTVLTFNPMRHPALPTRHLSLACNHCETAVCALGCPASAYRRDAATGAVILEPERCIGCRYCSWLCPYDAPRFDEAEGVMTKCTFCAPRLGAGRQPACTEACPTAALSIGTRNGSEPVFIGLPTPGLGPALEIVSPRRHTPPPALAGETSPGDLPAPRATRKITLRSEWTLAVFTTVMPALVAWLGSGLVRPEGTPAALPFLALAALALAVSTLHLGRPLRAWRALLNLRSSWLSREAALSAPFVGLGAASLFAPSAALGWSAFAAGLALVVSIDAVYRAIPRAETSVRHSADTVLTVLLLVGIGTATLLVAWTAAAVKALLFAARWLRGPMGLPAPLAGLRIVVLATAVSGPLDWGAAFALAVAGEALDRCAFYTELEPMTPASGMVAAAEASLRQRSPRAAPVAAGTPA